MKDNRDLRIYFTTRIYQPNRKKIWISSRGCSRTNMTFLSALRVGFFLLKLVDMSKKKFRHLCMKFVLTYFGSQWTGAHGYFLCVFLLSLDLLPAPEIPSWRYCASWMAGNVLLEKAFLASHCLNNNEVSIHVCAARFSDSAAIVLCNDLHDWLPWKGQPPQGAGRKVSGP